MKAVVYHGVGDIRLDEMPDPRLQADTDAVVRISTAAICGTDLHAVRGTQPGMEPGTIMGHEGVGIVEEMGRQVRNFNYGDRVVIASTVAFVRVLLAAAVISETFARRTAGPLLIMALLALLPCAVLWFRNGRHAAEAPSQQNPTHLKSAIVFAVMNTAVLWALAAAREYVADPRAIYAVAALSGRAAMDAITLSTARMSLAQPEVAATGWRLVLVGGLANLLGKALLAGALGGLRMMCFIAALFAVPAVGGVALLLFW